MIKATFIALSIVALAITATAPANAQVASQARPGSFGNTSATTNNYRRANSVYTTSQRLPNVRMAGLGGLASIHGRTGRNGLPVTRLDSFVLNAGGAAEMIYGDEGSDGPPPYFEFTAAHRIQRGIQGNSAGLTTGHGSYLPCAWGGDEYVDGPEFSNSANSNSGNYWANQVQVGPSPGTRPDMNQDNDQQNQQNQQNEYDQSYDTSDFEN